MTSIRDALQLKPVMRQLRDGSAYWLRRPSALDLIEAIEVQKSMPDRLHAWLAFRHVLDHDRQPVWGSIEEALAAPAQLVTEVAVAAEALYGEGRD